MSLLNFMLAANASRGNNCGTANGALPGLYDGLCSNGQVQVQSAGDIFVIVANVVRILMAVAGGLAVIVIIVGAIWYITAAGDPGRLKRAKDIIVQAVIGLVLVAVAYTIVTFIAGGF